MFTILLFIFQFTFFGQPTLDSEPIEESKSVNNIDFNFILESNTININAFFYAEGGEECIMNTSFDFPHKKAYTKGPSDLLLHKKGDDWYEAYFIIEKYFMAKVKALYHYSLHRKEKEIRFDLLSNEVNLRNFNVVNNSSGSISFHPKNGKTIIKYELLYELKPTMMKKMLFKIQKKETVKFLSDYKAYLEQHCS